MVDVVVGVHSSSVHLSSRGQVSRGAGPVLQMYLCTISYACYKCYKLITKAVNGFNVVYSARCFGFSLLGFVKDFEVNEQ